MHSITGTRFGSIHFLEQDVLTFSQGLIGFPTLTRFVLVEHRECSPFRWLQSVDEPALAFLTADPNHYCPEYAIEVPKAEVESLGLGEETPTLVLATVTIPHGCPDDMTLNLAGPIVINLEARTGRQLIVEGEPESLRRRILSESAAA